MRKGAWFALFYPLLSLLTWLNPAGSEALAQTPEELPTPPPNRAVAERTEERGRARWHVLRQEGREYVRFEDVKAFYHFDTLDVIGSEVVLEASKTSVSMRFLAGTKEAYINGNKTYLSLAPVEAGSRVYLSRVDLALLVDPTIRPPRSPAEEMAKATMVILQIRSGQTLAHEVAAQLRRGLPAFGMEARTSPPADATESSILARLLLLEHSGSEELQTLTLAPEGTQAHDGSTAPARTSRGNTHDRLNIALGMALHASMMKTVDGVLDGGLRRGQTGFLKSAKGPAAAIKMPVPNEASPEILGAAIVRGLRQYRKALGRP